MSTINSVSSSLGGNTSAVRGSNFSLKTEDFINMMVVQLQNQDPMEPAKNQELLAQMSQIGQLQSSSQMQETLQGLMTQSQTDSAQFQETLKSVMFQSQLSSAGGLIGMSVHGMGPDGKTPVNGVVDRVSVADGKVNLELDNGKVVPLGNVRSIVAPPWMTGGLAGQ